jgi:hypothetical protein
MFTKKSFIYFQLLPFCVVCTFLCTCTYIPPGDLCNYAAHERLQGFKGVVQYKFIDSLNHQERTVLLSNGLVPTSLGSKSADDWNAFDQRKQYWNYVQIGDTVHKIKHTNTVRVTRQGVRDTLFYIYHGCEDTISLAKMEW